MEREDIEDNGSSDIFYETITNFDEPNYGSFLKSIFGGLIVSSDDSYEKRFAQEEVSGLKSRIRKDLNWADIKINTAVIGNSGSGKSSFINSIRGKTAKDNGAAAVGYCETTYTCTSYEYPGNPSFLLWDIPGVGTPNFPKQGYLERIVFSRYDFFIIISKERITTNDVWLARKIQKRQKPFFFVRSNIDKDIQDNKNDYPESHNEKEVLQLIKTVTEAELTKNGVNNPKVFLISNRRTDKYDFAQLIDEMLESCDDLKRDAIVLSLCTFTADMKEKKKNILKGRIPKTAIEIASTSKKSDQKIIFKKEIDLYRQQFQVDDVTLDNVKGILSLTDDTIKTFRVFYDENMLDGAMAVKTPTAMRKEASFWDRLADFFTWSVENKLIFGFSKTALEKNLEVIYEKSKKFYDKNKFEDMVYNATS